MSAQLGVGTGHSDAGTPPHTHTQPSLSLAGIPQPSLLPGWHPHPLTDLPGSGLRVGCSQQWKPKWGQLQGRPQHTPSLLEWVLHLWRSTQAHEEAGGGSVSGNKAPFLPSLRTAGTPLTPASIYMETRPQGSLCGAQARHLPCPEPVRQPWPFTRRNVTHAHLTHTLTCTRLPRAAQPSDQSPEGSRTRGGLEHRSPRLAGAGERVRV